MCGIVGLCFTKPTMGFSLALTAGGGIQHRGQQGAGVAIAGVKDLIVTRSDGLLRQIFPDPVIPSFNQPAYWILLHCRYGTSGNYEEINLQPCLADINKKQKAAVVHNGEFVNLEEIKKGLGFPIPLGASDTYIFAKYLEKIKGKSFEEKVILALQEVAGSYGLIIGFGKKLIAARDRMGIRPLVLGQFKDGWVLASETHALDKINASIVRELKRGEIIRIDGPRVETIFQIKPAQYHFCDFEWDYFGRPDSLSSTHETKNGDTPDKWISFSSFRLECGRFLAQQSPIKKADFVIGIPDSGIPLGLGYANSLGIPYQQYIIRDHFDENGLMRLFMRDDEKSSIGKKVLGKLSLIPEKKLWKDKIVVLADDSIVRGNVSKQITQAVLAVGAKEVHWIIGFPPVMYPCHLGISIRQPEELIAFKHKGDPKKIAREIGATSVNYIAPENFVRARKKYSRLTRSKKKNIFLANDGCGGCLTGVYPVPKE